MKFTVDRKTWYRGQGSSTSMLLRGVDGKKCCLGFLGKACGFTDLELNHGTPVCSSRTAQWPTWIVHQASSRSMWGEPTPECFRLMEINDATDIVSDEVRERRLTDVFQSIGIEVEFVG